MSDICESLALDIIHLLGETGAIVHYHDLRVPSVPHEDMATVGITDVVLAIHLVDCVLIATEHSIYD